MTARKPSHGLCSCVRELANIADSYIGSHEKRTDVTLAKLKATDKGGLYVELCPPFPHAPTGEYAITQF